MMNFAESGILYFKPPILWEEETLKAVKVVERKPFTTTEVKKALN